MTAAARRKSVGEFIGGHFGDWTIVAASIVLWNRWGVLPVVVLMLARLALGALWKAAKA